MWTVVASLITAIGAILGVIITNNSSNSKTTQMIEGKLASHQAVTDVKIDMLTDEVRKHNNFATRIPTIELQINNIEKRIEKLEEK